MGLPSPSSTTRKHLPGSTLTAPAVVLHTKERLERASDRGLEAGCQPEMIVGGVRSWGGGVSRLAPFSQFNPPVRESGYARNDDR